MTFLENVTKIQHLINDDNQTERFEKKCLSSLPLTFKMKKIQIFSLKNVFRTIFLF